MRSSSSPAAYGFLAYHAQYVVRDYGKLQYQLVGVKFAGRKPFQIHIRLYLAVELFTFPMCMVQAYDFMVVQPKVRPPGIGLDVIGEQKLAVLVNRSVDDLIAGADGDGFLLAVFCFVGDAKTDMDLERLPSGKFDTNELVLELAIIAYNILRMIGQESIGRRGTETRHKVRRRRLRTVIGNLNP